MQTRIGQGSISIEVNPVLGVMSMVMSRAFFNAVAILFMPVLIPVICSAAGVVSQFVPLDRMPQPDSALCEELRARTTTNSFQDDRRCSDYRAPTLKQAMENITACFNTEANKLTGTPYVRPLFGWYKFCAEKTNGRNVTAEEIRSCFHKSLTSRDVQGRLIFDTCIADADRKKIDTNNP